MAPDEHDLDTDVDDEHDEGLDDSRARCQERSGVARSRARKATICDCESSSTAGGAWIRSITIPALVAPSRSSRPTLHPVKGAQRCERGAQLGRWRSDLTLTGHKAVWTLRRHDTGPIQEIASGTDARCGWRVLGVENSQEGTDRPRRRPQAQVADLLPRQLHIGELELDAGRRARSRRRAPTLPVVLRRPALHRSQGLAARPSKAYQGRTPGLTPGLEGLFGSICCDHATQLRPMKFKSGEKSLSDGNPPSPLCS